MYFKLIPYTLNTRSDQGIQEFVTNVPQNANIKKNSVHQQLKDIMKKGDYKGMKLDKIKWFIKCFYESIS